MKRFLVLSLVLGTAACGGGGDTDASPQAAAGGGAAGAAGVAGNAGVAGSAGNAGNAGSAGVAGVAGSAGAAGATAGMPIEAGVGVGAVKLGATYATAKAALGPATMTLGLNHLAFARYPSLGMELVVGSSIADDASDDAAILAIGVTGTTGYAGKARPGMSRAEIEAALGKAPDTADTVVYYPSGLSITYQADVATNVAVFAPYQPVTAAPEMTPAKTTGAPGAKPDPKKVGVVDMHLHPGFVGRLPSATKGFLIGSTPAFSRPYAPGIFKAQLDPFEPFVGIQRQTERAAVQHAVLFAVYTQKTTGFYANEDLEATLTDPRNVAPDGLPWAWGLASVNFFDGYVKDDGTLDETIAKSRLAALSSYFEKRRDLFIGIKLAHAHQAVAFDDPRYLGAYDVAAKHGVPVYLHTGFSPFPGSKTEPAYYDPAGLESVVVNHPNVSFVLGHVGQGDLSAVEHCLGLAKKHPNVYLELSALNRPLLRDADGHDIATPTMDPQYPWVVQEIKKRGIVDKAIFGTDGPQYSGMVKSYLGLLTTAMQDAGYGADEQHAVLAGNFLRVYFDVK